MIELYPHNQTAYNEVCKWLTRAGKAAVIHPTGTGKSFIAFKLCEENPGDRVCWLSPSVHIWKTQLENVKAVSGFVPQNITYLTYAKLMMLSPAERAAIQPDMIILDEFHRCGAEEWGRGVEALLADDPQAKLLGLTATPIRYLDQQRDMTAELFDGCVAHEMTLGEAIALGVLPAPKYVLSIYAFEQEWARYKRRVAKVGGAARQQAERLMEQLRQRLDEADGLEQIFERHMPDKHGKYLVFCADREHMEKMRSSAAKWFGRIDSQMQIFEMYAESAQARTVFQQFKEAKGDHLKLLYCIDMLNEGVHVEGLSGVILCRTTVSPIVYKQQIGRALSAADGQVPVIFDLVNNVENLYAISAVRREMEELVTFYANGQRNDEIRCRGFEVIDEIRDCRELFEKLEKTLSASWEMMYAEAAAYFRENGHLNVPKNYRTEANLHLGNWIQTQRRVRRGTCLGTLTESQISRLDAIGMAWKSAKEKNWENGLAHAQAYHASHGRLDVKARYVCEDGFALGSWLSHVRSLQTGKKRQEALSPEQVEQLNALGMVWNKRDADFERGYAAAVDYFVANGDLQAPAAYVTEDGFKLGAWLSGVQNRQKTLSPEQQELMRRIGFDWDGRYAAQWKRAFAHAQRYYREHGDLNVPAAYKVDDFCLGRWVERQRSLMSCGKLRKEQIERLETLGLTAEKKLGWDARFQEAKAYYEAHGDLNVPAKYVTGKGTWLSKWLSNQRKAREEGALLPEQQAALEGIGMVWLKPSQQAWQEKLRRVADCYDASVGDDSIADESLRRWFKLQRRKAAKGELAMPQLRALRMMK